MKRSRAGGVFGVLLLAWLIEGCTAVDHHDFFTQYERDYKQRVNYVEHAAPRDGLHIRAREYGAGKPGPMLIMMHGFPDSMHIYDWLVPLLADARHIVTFDFIGWGDSDKPVDHRYDVVSLRRDLEAVIDYFQPKKVVLVMHDASGQPGIDWALAHPQRVAGLVLLNTYYAPAPTLRPPEAIDLFSTPGIRRDLAVWATTHWDYLWQKRYNEQMARFFDNPARLATFQKVIGYQSLGIRPAFFGLNRVLRDEVAKRRARLPELQAFQPPVRIIFGRDDPYLNVGVAEDFHRLFPHSELLLIPGARHFVQIDQPERVAELLRAFPE